MRNNMNDANSQTYNHFQEVFEATQQYNSIKCILQSNKSTRRAMRSYKLGKWAR